MRVVGLRPFWFLAIVFVLGCGDAAATGPASPSPMGCDPGYPHPGPAAGAEIGHLKTAATVLSVTSPCTVLVTIAGGVGTLAPFTGKEITLRATSRTFYADGQAGSATKLGTLGLKRSDVFTLSFDSRPFPDGSYPLNFINR